MSDATVHITLPDGRKVEFRADSFPMKLEVETTKGRKQYSLNLHLDGKRVKSMTLT